MIPQIVTHQQELLSIDTTRAPFVRDAVMPGVDVQPLLLDPQNGLWVLRVLFAPGVTMPRHFHTGSVHVWTIAGRWNYVEHPENPQTAGCYLYEPGGSIHQFQTPADNTEPTDAVMVVTGSNVNFDDNGNFMNILDAGWIEAIVNHLATEQGLGKLKYISGRGYAFAGA